MEGSSVYETDLHDAEECIICTQQLDPTAVACLQCKNKCFHFACISLWARYASTCPLCRAELSPALVLRGNSAVSFVVDDGADADIVHHALRLAFSI